MQVHGVLRQFFASRVDVEASQGRLRLGIALIDTELSLVNLPLGI